MLRTDDNCPETERWLQITGKSMRWLRNTVRARMATHGPAAHAVLHDELTVKMGGGYDWGCNGMQDMADFFRRSDVQAALHLGKPGVSSFGYESSGPASITLYPELVTKMRVLIYNGDSDACVPCTPHDIAERAQLFQPVSAISLRTDKGNEEWTTGLAAAGSIAERRPWHPWFTEAVPNMPAGYATTYNVTGAPHDFSFVTIRLAGHMVPTFQPAAAFSFFSRYMAKQPF